MIAALRKAGVEVMECHETFWHGIEDRVATVSGGWLKPKFWLRLIRTYSRLLRKYRKVGGYDVLMVGYPGQFDVFLANWLRKITKKPLVWDVFMSIYLVAVERNLHHQKHSAVNWIKRVEGRALTLPDMLIQDTQAYVRWFHETYGIDEARFRLIPTGADDTVFKPLEALRPNNNVFQVLYYGTYIPNHGIDKIMAAARLLQPNENIRFYFVGEGPEKDKAVSYAQIHKLTNVSFGSWMEQTDLMALAARSNLCLGAFGDTPQSLMTVQNKIYECMAIGKTVLTGDSIAVRENLIPNEHILVCERTAEGIAVAILEASDNPVLCSAVGNNALKLFNGSYSILALGERLKCHLMELLWMKRHS